MVKNFEEFKHFFKGAFETMNGNIALEVIFIAALGIASSNIEELLSAWGFVIILSIIVLIITYYRRFNFLRKFPHSLVESVQRDVEQKDLELRISEFEKEKERMIVITNSISDTIGGLNDHTCTLNAKIDPLEEVTEKLCDSDVKEGLIKILSPFLKEIYSIVQSHSVKITLGVFFEELAQDLRNKENWEYALPILTIIKDENNLETQIPSDIMRNKNASGDLLKLQQILETCVRNNRFVNTENDLFGESFKIAASPIPLACNEKYSSGSSLIIIRGAIFPNDLDRIMMIFNKILSNWVYKYNQCVYSRSSEIQQKISLENGEVINLLYNGRYEIEKGTVQPETMEN